MPLEQRIHSIPQKVLQGSDCWNLDRNREAGAQKLYQGGRQAGQWDPSITECGDPSCPHHCDGWPERGPVGGVCLGLVVGPVVLPIP